MQYQFIWQQQTHVNQPKGVVDVKSVWHKPHAGIPVAIWVQTPSFITQHSELFFGSHFCHSEKDRTNLFYRIIIWDIFLPVES